MTDEHLQRSNTLKPESDSPSNPPRSDESERELGLTTPGTSHFNALTEAEQERLSILIEECGEVIQAGCKILRHGYNSNNKGLNPETNREALARELGDLLHAVDRVVDADDLDGPAIQERRRSKPSHIAKYLHHQPVAELPSIQEVSGILRSGAQG